MTRPAPIRFGVVGTAYWAETCHSAALAQHPDVDLVGFWGRDAAKAEAVAGRVGGRGFADFDEFLEAVDAVAIALSPNVQPTLAVKAAGAGKHLLLDKPLALNLALANSVVQATKDANVASVVFLTYRFDAQTAAWLTNMRELAAVHGPWEGAISRWTGSIGPDSPYAPSVWRRERGGLWDWGPHAISILDDLMPGIERVTATRGVRDTVNLAFEHRGGAGSSASLTVTAPATAAGTLLVVWGPGGRYCLPPLTGSYVATYQRAIDQLLDSATTGGAHPLDVSYARDLVAVLATADEYLGRPPAGRAAKVATFPDHPR